MVVGWTSTCPCGHVGAGYPYLIQHCQDPINWPTEWFYADLTSNYDTNGNGCWADIGTPALHLPSDDPTAAYHLTVAVGRIPFDDPTTVRAVLQNSMRFEQQSENSKRQTLAAESMFDLKGDSGKGWCWFPPDDPNGKYYNGGAKINGKDYDCYHMSSTGTDTSYLGHALQQDLLYPNGYFNYPLYENTPAAAGGSPYTSPKQSTGPNVVGELNALPHGLVHIGWHSI